MVRHRMETPPEKDDARAVQQATWAARFGWLAGGAAGVLLGFVLTWGIETRVLAGRVRDATAVATRVSAVAVPALFLVGALAGQAFGERGGARRVKLLGSAAGILLSLLGWAFLVVTR